MQAKKMIFMLFVVFIGNLQFIYAKVRNVEKWGNYIIEMQVEKIQKWCEKVSRYQESMPWIGEELQKMEEQFLTEMKRIKKVKTELPSITFEIKIKTATTVSFNIEDTERVSNALFLIWDSLDSLSTTLILYRSVCHLLPPKSYDEAKVIRNQVIQHMDLQDDGRFFLKNYNRNQQKHMYESLLSSANKLKLAELEGLKFDDEKFFSTHLEAFSFGYCQMLLNKIHKQHLGACQPDSYSIIPCTGCSGLLSNLKLINDTIQADGYQQDPFLEQWLSEWMSKFALLLFFQDL